MRKENNYNIYSYYYCYYKYYYDYDCHSHCDCTRRGTQNCRLRSYDSHLLPFRLRLQQVAETGDHEVNGSEGLAFLRDLRRLKTTFGRVSQGSGEADQGSYHGAQGLMPFLPLFPGLASLLLFLGSSWCPLEVYDSTWLQDGSQTASRDTKTTKIVIFHKFFNDFLNCEMAQDGLKMSA